MQIHRLDSDAISAAGGPAAVGRSLRAEVPDGESVAQSVSEIISRVRAGGDEALMALTREFDMHGAQPPPLLVGAEELDEAIRAMPLDLVAGLQVAISNVALVADAGVESDVTVTLPQGHRVVIRDVPVGSAAIYVPGGRAPYPSTVVMGVVTARSAGVLDVAVCAPPGPRGDIDPAILGTCRLCGVERVYRMGGAQAIAALAYGTETVDRVDVIVGPGNLYVQEAKRQLSSHVGIDGFAGPSDLLVVLGAGAGSRDIALAALDMLAQAEHGAGSAVVAACVGSALADRLEQELRDRGGASEAVALARIAIAQCDAPRDALALANAFAPEHLELIGADVEDLSTLVTSAGCLFVGASSATAFGDYVAGSNHVLPTAGAARFASTLSARTFRRRMNEVRVGPAAEKLAAAAEPIALSEGFVLHAESMRARLLENEGP